jgi:hypothetical protein
LALAAGITPVATGGGVDYANNTSTVLQYLVGSTWTNYAADTNVSLGVNGKLFAGHAIQRKARANLGHPARAFGNDDEVDDQKHKKDHQPQKQAAAHCENETGDLQIEGHRIGAETGTPGLSEFLHLVDFYVPTIPTIPYCDLAPISCPGQTESFEHVVIIYV